MGENIGYQSIKEQTKIVMNSWKKVSVRIRLCLVLVDIYSIH